MCLAVAEIEDEKILIKEQQSIGYDIQILVVKISLHALKKERHTTSPLLDRTLHTAKLAQQHV